MKSLKSVFVINFLISQLLSGCINQSPENPSNGNQANNICEWMYKSYVLRSTRINAITSAAKLIIEDNPDKIDEMYSEIVKSIDAMNEFVIEWKKLGYYENEFDLWNNELESVEMKIDGFTTMKNAIDNGDIDEYLNGYQVIEDSGNPGRKAELRFIELTEYCNNK